MSILSFDKRGSAAPDSSFPPSPPQDFNHGFLPHHQHQQPRHQSPPVSISASLHNPYTNPAGSSSSPADHDGSPTKVNELDKPHSDRNSAPGKALDHEISYQVGFGSIPHLGKSSKSPITSNTGKNSSSASYGVAASSSGRKSQMISGNHLLNFHYDPISRSHPRSWVPPPRRQQRRKPYNKDLFIQANYKFVMLDTANCTPESRDPDKMLQWEDIICLKYYTPVQVQCPICLDYPLCPQITFCGHIYCFPCVLRYLMLDADDHRAEYNKKCPLCFTMISSKDLFTIHIENVKPYNVGDAIEFWLLTRSKESFILSLKDNEGLNATGGVQDSFSKFTYTSDVDVSVREAMSDLDSWLARADSGLVDDLEKLPFVCAAIKLLRQRNKYWKERQFSHGHMACGHTSSLSTFSGPSNTVKALSGPPNTSNVSNIDINVRESTRNSPSYTGNDQCARLQNLSLNKSTSWIEIPYACESSDDHDEVLLSSTQDDNKSLQTQVDYWSGEKSRDSYHFYQAVDGQNLILHPLNMKCLLHHYGSYDRLPNRIIGKILELESVTQSEAMRKRYRYLSHFSLTATFQFCEIDLTETLPADALLPFMDEISNREKRRKKLARKEHREKIKAEAAGLHFIPVTVNLEQNSYDESSATFSMDDFEALGSSTATSSSPTNMKERQSFSNVARLGFAAGHDSPALKAEDGDSSCPAGSAARSTGNSSSGPSFASVASRGKPTASENIKQEGGKKGKKGGRVLMSTYGGRRY